MKKDGKIAYISGPISGLLNGNFDAFKAAQEKLEMEGYIVLNPHEICKDIYNKWALKPPTNGAEERVMWEEMMKECIRHLTLADDVFVLSNWETSKGATVELFIAQKLGISTYYSSNYETFQVAFGLQKLDRIPL